MYMFWILADNCVGTSFGVCRCVVSWCDLDLIIDLAIVTLTNKFLSELYHRNHNV